MQHFPSLLHAASPSELPPFPPPPPPPPSPTSVRVSSVTILLMSCVFCSAMIMYSSLQVGQSSLMLASENGHHEVVEVLLSAGANVDLQDEVSSTSPSRVPTVTCPDVMLYCGLEGNMHTIVVEII